MGLYEEFEIRQEVVQDVLRQFQKHLNRGRECVAGLRKIEGQIKAFRGDSDLTILVNGARVLECIKSFDILEGCRKYLYRRRDVLNEDLKDWLRTDATVTFFKLSPENDEGKTL